jgi:hypothetical protein
MKVLPSKLIPDQSLKKRPVETVPGRKERGDKGE